jgi:hypothetical protein
MEDPKDKLLKPTEENMNNPKFKPKLNLSYKRNLMIIVYFRETLRDWRTVVEMKKLWLFKFRINLKWENKVFYTVK